MKEAESVLVTLKDSALMQDLWKSYQQKFPYASDYSWDDVMWSTRKLAHEAGLTVEKNILERSLFKVMHTLSPACTAFTLENDKMSFHREKHQPLCDFVRINKRQTKDKF